MVLWILPYTLIWKSPSIPCVSTSILRPKNIVRAVLRMNLLKFEYQTRWLEARRIPPRGGRRIKSIPESPRVLTLSSRTLPICPRAKRLVANRSPLGARVLVDALDALRLVLPRLNVLIFTRTERHLGSVRFFYPLAVLLICF